MLEIISQQVRKARKEHECDWCLMKIKKGEQYEHSTLKLDDIYTWKNHLDCQKLYKELNMYDHDYGEGIDSEAFQNSVEGYLDENGIEYNTWEEALSKAKELLLRGES